MKHLLFILIFLSNSALAGSTVYLVRHAEKITTEGVENPDLTAIGKFRAQNIAKQLSKVGITEIYSSNYNRTLQTAQPLADFLKLEIKKYDPSKLVEFAERVKSMQGTILIVGHSNTTPNLTSLISGKKVHTIQDDEYDNLYQVISTKNETILNRFKTIPSYLNPSEKQSQSQQKFKITNKTIKISLPNEKINHEN